MPLKENRADPSHGFDVDRGVVPTNHDGTIKETVNVTAVDLYVNRAGTTVDHDRAVEATNVRLRSVFTSTVPVFLPITVVVLPKE